MPNYLEEVLEEVGMQVLVDLRFVVAVDKTCHLEDVVDMVADDIHDRCYGSS